MIILGSYLVFGWYMELFFLGLVWASFVLFPQVVVFLSLAGPPGFYSPLISDLVLLSSFGFSSPLSFFLWGFDSRSPKHLAAFCPEWRNVQGFASVVMPAAVPRLGDYSQSKARPS
jgi:hypothetical protein